MISLCYTPWVSKDIKANWVRAGKLEVKPQVTFGSALAQHQGIDRMAENSRAPKKVSYILDMIFMYVYTCIHIYRIGYTFRCLKYWEVHESCEFLQASFFPGVWRCVKNTGNLPDVRTGEAKQPEYLA